jgi:hypothetical protein
MQGQACGCPLSNVECHAGAVQMIAPRRGSVKSDLDLDFE